MGALKAKQLRLGAFDKCFTSPHPLARQTALAGNIATEECHDLLISRDRSNSTKQFLEMALRNAQEIAVSTGHERVRMLAITEEGAIKDALLALFERPTFKSRCGHCSAFVVSLKLVPQPVSTSVQIGRWNVIPKLRVQDNVWVGGKVSDGLLAAELRTLRSASAMQNMQNAVRTLCRLTSKARTEGLERIPSQSTMTSLEDAMDISSDTVASTSDTFKPTSDTLASWA